jgi:hypothetical protein
LLKLDLEPDYTPELPVRRLEALLASKDAIKIGSNNQDALIEGVRKVAYQKQDYDAKIINQSISPEQYSEQLNKDILDLQDTFVNNLSESDYKELMDMDPTEKISLIDAGMLRDSLADNGL